MELTTKSPVMVATLKPTNDFWGADAAYPTDILSAAPKFAVEAMLAMVVSRTELVIKTAAVAGGDHVVNVTSAVTLRQRISWREK